MQIQVNTDKNIAGSEDLQQQVEGVVEGHLSRFGDRITRVEVHLNDVNGDKPGDDDNRCVIEARLAGMQPISATHQADTLEQALDGAARKLQRLLDTALEKSRGY